MFYQYPLNNLEGHLFGHFAMILDKNSMPQWKVPTPKPPQTSWNEYGQCGAELL